MTKIVSFLVLATLLVSGVAFAEAVSGKVASIDPATKLIKVAQVDEAGAEQEVSIWVSEATTFEGVAGLDALEAGTEVSIDASQDAATGDWKADSVKVAAVEAPAAQ